jgi:hypothetical protein
MSLRKKDMTTCGRLRKGVVFSTKTQVFYPYRTTGGKIKETKHNKQPVNWRRDTNDKEKK